MLNAWHLPVAPFVKQHNDKLTINAVAERRKSAVSRDVALRIR